MNTIGQISEINFKIGEIFISEWTLSLNGNRSTIVSKLGTKERPKQLSFNSFMYFYLLYLNCCTLVNYPHSEV